MNKKKHLTKQAASITTLLLITLLIPLTTATPSTEAAQAGYHQTLYADQLQASTNARTYIDANHRLNANQGLRAFNDFRVIIGSTTRLQAMNNGGIRIGGGTTNPPDNGLFVNGHLLLNQQPTQDNHAATKLYVDDQIASVSGGGGGSSLWSEDGPSNIYYQSGFVGIGTSSPDTRLHVVGTTYLNGDLGIGTDTPQHALDVERSGETTIRARSTTTSPPSHAGFQASAGSVQGILQADGLNSRLVLGSTSNTPVSVRTNDIERLRIDEDGNVGIGTSNPRLQLEVTGDAYFPQNAISEPGPIVHSPNGNCWRLTVTNTGASSTTGVTCPGSTVPPPQSMSIDEIRRNTSTMEVQLSWNPPSDMSTIENFRLYQGDTLIATVSETTTSYAHSVFFLQEGDVLTYSVSTESNVDESVKVTDTYTVRYGGIGTYESSIPIDLDASLYCRREVTNPTTSYPCKQPRVAVSGSQEHRIYADIVGSPSSKDGAAKQWCVDQGYSDAVYNRGTFINTPVWWYNDVNFYETDSWELDASPGYVRGVNEIRCIN